MYVFDSTTNLPKTGDAANLTAYVSKDYGTVTVLGDTTATEMDSTNAKGYYLFDLTQAETNADTLLFSCKSSTSNMVALAMPATVFTTPANFTALAITAGGIAKADLQTILTTAVSSPATAGILDVNVKNINNVAAATPGASGGILISGSNSGTTTLAALTVSGATTLTGNVSMAAGLNITQSSSNTSALVVTGNGTGHGAVFTSGSGATGNGVNMTAASTNGNGLAVTGIGTGAGELATGGATGHGVSYVGGATSGDGMRSTATTSGKGINAIGIGTTMPGILATGGATTSAGLSLIGGATSGDGLLIAATTSGHGISSTGVGTTKHGINAAGGSTTSHGISATGGGVGHGILATSGGGSTGDGIRATAASTNGNGFNLVGVGTGAGLLSTGGLTGQGFLIVGGGTSGDGIKVTTTSGNGINLAPVGTSMHGFLITGGNGGTSDGLKCVAGTGGVPIRGNITGNITGTIDTVTAVTGLTASNLDATISSRMATYTQPTGFLAATFPGGTIANTTNITAGTITTVTTVTNQLTAAQIATGVWQDSTAGDFTAASSIGKSLYTSGAVPGAAGGLFIAGTNAATTVNFTGTITTVTNLTNLPAITNNWLTAAGIASGALVAAVWDGTISGHTTSGTFGGALNAAGSAGDPWSTTLPGAYSSGTAGYILGTNLDATITSRASPTNITAGTITTVTNLTNAPSSGDLTSTMKSSVAAAVLDAAMSSHVTTGTVGWWISNQINAYGTASDSLGSATSFKTNLTAADDVYNDQLIVFKSGALSGQVKPISSYVNTNGVVTVGEAFTTAPSASDLFYIIPTHVHPTSQIASAVWQDTTSGDFTISGSIGKSLFTSGNAPGASSGLAIVGSSMATSDKTGFKLASDGLDSVATTAPTGVASNFREMLVQVWRKFFKKSTLTATELKTYADNGSTVLTTQTVSDDTVTQVQGPAT